MLRFLLSNSLLFGILSGDFQCTNRSVDVVLPPDRLPLIRIILPYPKTNFLRSCIFRTSWRSQDMFC